MVPKPLAYLKSQEEANTAASCALPGVPNTDISKYQFIINKGLKNDTGPSFTVDKIPITCCWGKYGNMSSIQCTKHLRDMVCAVVAVSNLLRLAKVG